MLLEEDLTEKSFDELADHLPNFSKDKLIHTISTDSVNIEIPGCNKPLSLKPKNIHSLLDHKKIENIKDFVYHEHYGFSFNLYGEYFISISNSVHWIAPKPLKFKIDNYLIEIGPGSIYIKMLLEPYYGEEDIGQVDFEDYTTIKIIGTNFDNHENLLHNAIYYLNSYYFKSINLYASLMHLIHPDEVYNDFIEDRMTREIIRERIRNRQSLSSVEPLRLFNEACTLSGESRFLGFYKVLEYFFSRSLMVQFHSMRADRNITDDELIGFVKKRDEASLLKKLLNSCITPAHKKRLASIAKNRGLITKETFTDLTNALYDFRNSVVHAKEEFISQAVIPNPLKFDSYTNLWNSIVRDLAVKAIQKYNIRSK